jgi:hypothetical protein
MATPSSGHREDADGMTRMWRISSPATSSVPSRATGAWTCQLVRAALENDALVLDLVDIDHDPHDTGVSRPRGPFTLHVGAGDGLTPDSSTVIGWAAGADIVTLVSGRRVDDVDWLCLSSDDDHLVLELGTAAG